MKIGLIAFTKKGGQVNSKICEGLMLKGDTVEGFLFEKYAIGTSLSPFLKLSELTQYLFKEMDGIIFIGACGIAVRAIAPYLHNKMLDPAVIVVDEGATFVISLLSGHIGGANELTKCVAEIVEAIPVITTATDVNDKFAVDNWAMKNSLIITDISLVKLISSRVLNGEKIGVSSELQVEGALPTELTYDEVEVGICISRDVHKKPFPKTLSLVPRNIVLGIGCRRDITYEKIEDLVEKTLKKYDIDTKRVCKLCSIDLKSKEQGIIQLANKYGVDFVTFAAAELEEVKGEFASSMFVKTQVGVDNVCERSAVLGSNLGKLVIPKTANTGVTVAVCEMEYTLQF